MAIGLSVSSAAPMIWYWTKIMLSVVSIIPIAIFGLWGWKQSRFKNPVIVIRETGTGKPLVYFLKAGRFKSTKVFFKLIDLKGAFQITTNKGHILVNADQALLNIGGKLGYACYQDPNNPNNLLPISNLKVEGTDMVAAIAKGDWTEFAVQSYYRTRAELSNPIDRYLPYITLSILIGVVILAIIFLLQFATNNIKELSNACMVARPATVALLPSGAP